MRLGALALALAVALGLGACGKSDRPRMPGRDAADPTGGIEIAVGVRLLPGDDGKLPVRPTWVRTLDVPDALAIDGAVVYVYDPGTGLVALQLSDGSTVWNSGPEYGEGIGSSGGVVIGLAGSGRVRAWAPYETDLEVSRSTGKILRLRRADSDLPPRLAALPPMPVRDREFVDRANLVEMHDSTGRLEWRIEIDSPNSENLEPLAVPSGGIILALASGHVVRLDDR